MSQSDAPGGIPKGNLRKLLSHIRYPTDTRQLTSPKGEADVRSLEGYDVAGVGRGEFSLRLASRQRVAPLYWRSDTHTHTHRKMNTLALRGLEELFLQLCCCVRFLF